MEDLQDMFIVHNIEEIQVSGNWEVKWWINKCSIWNIQRRSGTEPKKRSSVYYLKPQSYVYPTKNRKPSKRVSFLLLSGSDHSPRAVQVHPARGQQGARGYPVHPVRGAEDRPEQRHQAEQRKPVHLHHTWEHQQQVGTGELLFNESWRESF